MTRQFDTLLQKEMSRREFMTTMGLGLVSILGFSSVLRLLGHGPAAHSAQSGNGYGARPYGK